MILSVRLMMEDSQHHMFNQIHFTRLKRKVLMEYKQLSLLNALVLKIKVNQSFLGKDKHQCNIQDLLIQLIGFILNQ